MRDVEAVARKIARARAAKVNRYVHRFDCIIRAAGGNPDGKAECEETIRQLESKTAKDWTALAIEMKDTVPSADTVHDIIAVYRQRAGKEEREAAQDKEDVELVEAMIRGDLRAGPSHSAYVDSDLLRRG